MQNKWNGIWCTDTLPYAEDYNTDNSLFFILSGLFNIFFSVLENSFLQLLCM